MLVRELSWSVRVFPGSQEVASAGVLEAPVVTGEPASPGHLLEASIVTSHRRTWVGSSHSKAGRSSDQDK